MDTIGSWLRKNANVVLILLIIFGLALFLRAYFPLGQSLQGHLLSGGSDSYYWERIIRNIVTTGKQLDWDPLLNYPMGLGNPRPPIFSWFIAVPGIALSPLVGDTWQSVMNVFILSTAIWGALTIFPTYFLTKNIFGKRAGLVAAFLLAIMPAHLQRSQATDADHDSMVLFFVVTSFFFFMKALKALNERRWVVSWNVATKDGRSSIAKGLGEFLGENQKAMLYSVMSGLAMATVALIWQGWAYAPIILLVYVVLQLFVSRLRDKDPMGMGICFTITMGVALLLAAPWYILYGQVKTWYDVPLILFLAAATLGFILTVTRNFPWAIVVPAIILGASAVLVALSILNPAVANAFVSGAGYFVRTKLYETIAEAQPPGISQAILSFGAVTYFLSLFGLFWMAWKLPKRFEPDYMFVLTWSFTAIFMSMAAARFIFNASPAFAVTSGWVIILIVEWLNFDSMKKTFFSLSGGSKLTAIRKSVKVRHVLGALFIVSLLLLPNVWHGVDASIPYEQKGIYDRQVYNAMPSFMRPQGYTPPTTSSGSTFYFGAFGYSLPLSTGYFPASWDWFAKQDAALPPLSRPAYLSWWDYGFEAVDRGEHPTVADNFQDGYQLAGQFITAQTEDQAVALLAIRLLEGDYYGNKGHLSDGINEVLERHGLNPVLVGDSFRGSARLVNVVLGDPITYGRWDSQMQPNNALYIYLAHYMDSMTTTDEMASLYHDIRDVTGWSIRYFSVDSRMFPIDGGGNNIFYAPVKLSDHRVLSLPDGRVLPIDFFTIDVQTDKGTFQADAVPLGATVQSYNIKYTDMFYNSMFYRAYMGFGPKDVGQACTTNDCLPGIRGDLQTMMPMQGWNMSHFKVVYKTSYFNPWGISQYQNHTEDWQAVNYYDIDGALNLQRKINRGEITGVVDFSNNTLARSGLVYLKYYDGAYVNGTVTVDGVTPLPGVRVTVQDYEDPTNPTPHQSVITDAEGRYSLLAPFGQLRIVASIGTVDGRTMTGSTVLDQEFLTIRDDQAMRLEVDRDGDGISDYNIRLNVIVRGVTIMGTAFQDVNKDGNVSEGEELVTDAHISFKHSDLGLVRNASTDANGRFLFSHAYRGTYTPTVTYRGRDFKGPQFKVDVTDEMKDIAINTTKLEGIVLLPGNFTASGATVEAFDELWGNSKVIRTSGSGQYGLDLLPGNYTLSATLGENATLPQHIIVGTSPLTYNITLVPSGLMTGRTSIEGLIQDHVMLNFRRVGALSVSTTTVTDATGSYLILLPAGTYEVSSRHYRQGQLYAFLGRVEVSMGKTTVFDPNFSKGVIVRGVAFSVDKTKGGIGGMNLTFNNGQGSALVHTSMTDGSYTVFLPEGDYTIQTGYYNLTYLKRESFFESRTYDLDLKFGILVIGQAFYDKNRNGFVEPDEGVEDARVTFTDSSGSIAETFSGAKGRYEVTLPSGLNYLMQIAKDGFQTLSIGPASLQTLAPKFVSSIKPINITVSGQLLLQGSSLVGRSVEVRFNSSGSGSISASVQTDALTGRYTTQLAPGKYDIAVDQPVIPDQNDVRYQSAKSEKMTLGIGQAATTKDIILFTRMRVSGVVQIQGISRPASMVFQGSETAELTAENGTFSLMLAEGEYTLYANYTLNSIPYAAFEALSVHGPLVLQVGLDRAAVVEGSIKYGGNVVPEEAPVSFVSDQGARFEQKTDADGRYSADLVPGNYTVNVDYQSIATIDYVKRYVRYAHSSTLLVEQGRILITHDLSMTRTLDNSTFVGRLEYQSRPVAATLEFRPTSPDGMNATAVANADGTYTIQLTSGPYMMYIHDPVTHGVNLQSIQVEPRAFTYMNLSLEKGCRVSGVTTYLNHVKIPSRAIFSNSVTWDVYSDSNGYFEAYVPAQIYTLRVSTMFEEHGLGVGYNNTIKVNVTGDTPVGEIPMSRVPRQGWYLSYDERQVRPVPAGGSIQYVINVSNTGSMKDTVKLQGATIGWTVEFDRDILDVDFGTVNGVKVNDTQVLATIKVPFGATVEHPQVSITAYSASQTSVRYTLKLKVEVERTRGIVLRTTEIKPVFDGRFLNYTLEVVNTGNSVERVEAWVDNAGEVGLLGWQAGIKANATSPLANKVDGIIVGANSTARISVVVENTGGTAGLNIKVKAKLQDGTDEGVISMPTVLPSLSLDGSVVVAGSGIERQEGWNMTLVTVLAAFFIVIGIFVSLELRDRWRASRR